MPSSSTSSRRSAEASTRRRVGRRSVARDGWVVDSRAATSRPPAVGRRPVTRRRRRPRVSSSPALQVVDGRGTTRTSPSTTVELAGAPGGVDRRAARGGPVHTPGWPVNRMAHYPTKGGHRFPGAPSRRPGYEDAGPSSARGKSVLSRPFASTIPGRLPLPLA